MRLIAAPSQNGTTCTMLTFAAGRAQSAAAILLAHGAYAVAVDTAQIHFHGLRQQTRAFLTTELAAEISSALQNENDNLVLKAARALAEAANIAPDASLALTKNLPVASGIGGGSADAAAALRQLSALWRA